MDMTIFSLDGVEGPNDILAPKSTLVRGGMADDEAVTGPRIEYKREGSNLVDEMKPTYRLRNW